MNRFLWMKVFKIAISISLIVVSLGCAFALLFFGQKMLANNFIAGSLMIGVSPFVIFSVAYAYQFTVVLSYRQICAVSNEGLGKIQRSLVRSARETMGFTSLVPIMIIVLAIMMAIGFVPGSIGRLVMVSRSGTEEAVASIIIAANFLLFLKMSDQASLAINSLKSS